MPFFYGNFMRLLFIVLLLCLSGCAQLKQGQAQPVKQLSDNLYVTTCSGMAETMGDCFQKANKTCSGPYAMVKEVRDSSGVHRELTFKCIKK